MGMSVNKSHWVCHRRRKDKARSFTINVYSINLRVWIQVFIEKMTLIMFTRKDGRKLEVIELLKVYIVRERVKAMICMETQMSIKQQNSLWRIEVLREQ